MSVQLSETAIDPWRIIPEYQNNQAEWKGKYGATSVFVGTMRDFNQGDGVRSMFLDYYPGMTEKQLHAIVELAGQKWRLLDCLVVHRVGEVRPEDVLVVVATWAAHRGDAFDASRFVMEQLKSKAPFWKKETLSSGQQRWVEKNSDGYQR